MRGIHSEEVKSIMEFIYLGKASFEQEMLTEFLSVAIMLNPQMMK